MEKERAYSQIEELKGRHNKIGDIQREARAYFGGEGNLFNINRPRYNKVNSDRQRLQEDGRTLPERLRDELRASIIFEVWNVQYAIEAGRWQEKTAFQQSGIKQWEPASQKPYTRTK